MAKQWKVSDPNPLPDGLSAREASRTTAPWRMGRQWRGCYPSSPLLSPGLSGKAKDASAPTRHQLSSQWAEVSTSRKIKLPKISKVCRAIDRNRPKWAKSGENNFWKSERLFFNQKLLFRCECSCSSPSVVSKKNHIYYVDK